MMRFFALGLAVLFTACSGTVHLDASREHRTAGRLVEHARAAINAGAMAEAGHDIDSALGLAAAYNLPDIRVSALLVRAKISSIQGRWEEAFAAISEAGAVAGNEAPELTYNVVLSDAALQWESGNRERAKLLLDGLAAPSDSIEPGYCNLRGVIAFGMGNADEAKRYALRAFSASERQHNFAEKSAALKLLAHMAFKENKPEEAIAKVKESQDIDRKLSNIRSILWDLEFLAEIYASLGQKQKAQYYYAQGHEAAVKAGDPAKAQFFLDKAKEALK